MHLADLGKSLKKHPEIAQGEEVESFPLLGSTRVTAPLIQILLGWYR